MKKLTILFITICIASTGLFAQETITDYRSKLMIGIKVGGNYANVYDTAGEKFAADGKFGSAVGIFTSIPLGKFLGIQPEILYSQKGFKATGDALGVPYSLTRTTDYIDIPLLLTIKPSKMISILAGPQFSYLLKKKDVFTTSLTNVEQEEKFSNENIRKNTMGVTGGIDFNFSHVVVGTRVGWDLQNNNGDGTSATPQYKNAWYQATVGLRF